MHPGQRSSGGYGNRSGFTPRRGFVRGGGLAPGPKPHHLPPPPPPRRSEILSEAGRLAAEYLVAKGVIPPHLLPHRPHPPPPPDCPRTSALSRLGGPDRDPVRLRRRTPDGDDYDDPRRAPQRKNWKDRQRPGPYYASENVRDRSYPPRGEYDDGENYYNYEEDDIAPGFNKKGSSSREEPPILRSEIVVESQIDDTTSKLSTSCSWKDSNIEAEVDSNKATTDAKILNLETNQKTPDPDIEDLELATGDERGIEDSDIRDIAKGDVVGDTFDESIEYKNNDSDLVRFPGFSKVPTKPRSSVAQRNQHLEQDLDVEENKSIEVGSYDVSMVNVEEVKMEIDSSVELDKSTECQIADNHIEIEKDSDQDQLVLETEFTVDVSEKREEIQDANEKPELENLQGSSPVKVSHADEYAMQGLEMEQRDHYSGPMPMDDEMISDDGPQKPMDACLLPEVKAELDEEDRKFNSKTFKIGDLNLISCSEVIEAPDTYAVNPAAVSVSNPKDEKELAMPFPLPLPANVESFGNFNPPPGDEKFIPVINLEDDCPLVENDPSQPKTNPMYASLDNVLTHAQGAVELPVIQDGYGIVPQELLGNDIPGCPSVSSDISNMQTGFGLHGAEVFPGDDIYVTLGELPIGFMEGWDQQNQEYGNFF